MSRAALVVLALLASSSGLAAKSSDVALITADCTDSDADGYFAEDGCGTPVDCNDANPATYPGTVDGCDGYDNDCDASLDDAPGCTSCDAPGKEGDDIQVTDDPGSEMFPFLVWTGAEYAMVWESDSDIYFTRLDASGHNLGPDMRVTEDTFLSSRPVLAWTGSEYGVMWLDSRDAPGLPKLYFARLDAAGNRIGLESRVSEISSKENTFSLLWTGTHYAVTWAAAGTYGYLGRIYFTRLDRIGTKVGIDVPVTNEVEDPKEPSLVWTGSEYGLAWTDYRDAVWRIYFEKLDTSGNKVGSDIPITDGSQPSLAWTGNGYGLAWSNYSYSYGARINFVKLDATGNIVGPEIIINGSTSSSKPSLIWTGGEYGVTWLQDAGNYKENVYVARLDATGNKIGNDVLVTNGACDFNYSFSWTGRKYGVAWFDALVANYDIYLAQVACNCVDTDGDGVHSCAPDNCPTFPNPDQLDYDGDGVGDACDNCVSASNPDQVDADQDTYGMPCDCDDANSSIHPDATELCDGRDNNCNGIMDEGPDGVLDVDGDGVPGACDNCPSRYNPDQLDEDQDGVGNACDNCIFVPNLDQVDVDLM